MCLNDIKYNQKRIEKLPETVTAYKVVLKTIDCGTCTSIFRDSNTPFVNGINKANTRRKIYKGRLKKNYYKSGFHFFLDKRDTKILMHEATLVYMWHIGLEVIIISCKVKKEDITVIGKEKRKNKGFTIVASKAIFNLPN